MTTATKYNTHTLYKEFLGEVSFQMFFLSSLVVFFAWYILRQPTSKKKSLSKLEEEKIIDRFQPEQLIPEKTVDVLALKTKIVTSRAGKNIMVNGHYCLNLATYNYLSLGENPEILLNASKSISKYGVGSCGPRGFYGTVDVHLELEENLANFMEVEEACVYSYAFATMSSAIPAYCKRGDIVFVDQAVNFSIQKGLDASRSNIKYFKHNDTEDLETLLKEQQKINLKNPKKAAKTRMFLIVEGIYLNTGEICNLPELIRLRKEYKLRMIMDESISFGTLGATGKGVVEYFNIPNFEVDLRIGSMEGALASVGGFCCGSFFIVEHQRLSGLGYCFSASLPPVLAVTALESLDYMRKNPYLFDQLSNICVAFHKNLSELPYIDLSGNPHSPVKHLFLKQKSDFDVETNILNKIVDYCLEKNLAIVVPQYLVDIEKFPVRPSLRLTANVSLTQKDIEFACGILLEAFKQCLPINFST